MGQEAPRALPQKLNIYLADRPIAVRVYICSHEGVIRLGHATPAAKIVRFRMRQRLVENRTCLSANARASSELDHMFLLVNVSSANGERRLIPFAGHR
jgi:hypothetical protein